MILTMEEAQMRMETNGGWLDLSGCTGLTALPEGLTVGGELNLSWCTGLTSLPEGLTVGGWLNLNGCTGLTALPEGLTVGGAIYKDRGQIKVLPRKVRKLHHGDYAAGRYLYADGILTHVRGKKTVNGYTLYVGKIPGRNVVSDGTYYAHCSQFADGIADIAYKRTSERGAEQYKGLDLDTPMSVEDLVTMYRVITGACRQGSQAFVDSIADIKPSYTIREAIELTRGQFNAERFREFFGEE